MVSGMDKADVAKIASGLTERQRQAMLGAHWIHPGGQDPICLVDYTEPWTQPVAQVFTLASDRLTLLGQSVRQYLMEKEGERA